MIAIPRAEIFGEAQWLESCTFRASHSPDAGLPSEGTHDAYEEIRGLDGTLANSRSIRFVCFARGVVPRPMARSSDGKHLWQRPVRTEREDLRLGAGVLLVAAAVLAYLGSIAYSDSDRHPAAVTGPKARDIDQSGTRQTIVRPSL